jgi:hypothetical protein
MRATTETTWLNYQLFRAQEHGWDDWRIAEAHRDPRRRDPLALPLVADSEACR